MTFARAVRSELVRLRRSPLVPLHLAIAIAVGAGCGAYFALTPWDPYLSCDAFMQLLGAGAPLLVGLSCGLAIDAEREAGEYMYLLGVSSRRTALAAKGTVLLVLGLLAAALATVLFCGFMLAFGRPTPALPALAQAVAGIALGCVALYVVFIAIALKWGRNAAIGMGALGLMCGLLSIGGLANGLVTGTFSGAMMVGALVWVPFTWPVRLASLSIEIAVAGVAAVANGPAQVPMLAGSLHTVACTCGIVTVVFVVLGLALANRFEDARRGGE